MDNYTHSTSDWNLYKANGTNSAGSPHVDYQVTGLWVPSGATLTISEEFELTRRRILIGEYGKFRAFCHKIDSLLDQKILLETK